MDEDYKVYIHIFPNNKKYVGITKQNVDKRWSNGKHYKNQMVGKAITKYGWNNIKHKIIADKLSKEEACNLEQKLIKKYKSNQKEYGYNLSTGGEVGKKNTYMCSDAVQFINKYDRYLEDKDIFNWWRFICQDELESKVFNKAYLFVDNIIAILLEKKLRIEWCHKVVAINLYLEAWKNNWKPECAEYNVIYYLTNYGQITYNYIFNKNDNWKKKELIGSD